MTLSLAHRGPDDAALHRGDGFGLGFRRLSIIDPMGGAQPFRNEDSSLWVVFNGEIYNHASLRRDLIARGHSFRSDHADGEVIAHLYEEHGDEFLAHLDGMFALALWNGRRQTLVLARDRLGIKPLYYALLADGSILFGSEPKAILASALVPRRPDRLALHHYLSFRNIPAPFSAFAGLRQLRPAEAISWEGGQLHHRIWWTPPSATPDAAISEDEAAETVLALLRRAVRSHLEADVPVGAYLSGGLDSSLIAALAVEAGARNLHTFTLIYDGGFPAKDSDRDHARRMSEHLGSRHHEHLVRANDLAQSLDRITAAFDEPFAGVTSTFFLTETIARHVKVALSGDGADELFGSYLPHRLAKPVAIARTHGVPARIPAELLPWLTPYGADSEELWRLAALPGEAESRMEQLAWTEAEKHDVYSPAMRDAVGSASTSRLLAGLYDQAAGADPLNRALWVDAKTLLPDQVLAFVDRLSMAHSVEVRPPFLDHHLVEYVSRLPGDLKIARGRVKHLLKQAAAPILPPEVIDRPKEGFVMPVDQWMLGELRDTVRQWLDPVALERMTMFDLSQVEKLRRRAESGDVRASRQIWSIVALSLWWDRHVR